MRLQNNFYGIPSPVVWHIRTDTYRWEGETLYCGCMEALAAIPAEFSSAIMIGKRATTEFVRHNGSWFETTSYSTSQDNTWDWQEQADRE